jgi:sec-independent protein translocase protein TatA
MAGIGVTELLIVLGIILLIFGPKRLPLLGRQLGSGMREFKDSITKRHEDDDDEDDAADRPAIPAATVVTPAEPVQGEVVPERRDS